MFAVSIASGNSMNVNYLFGPSLVVERAVDERVDVFITVS
jgi:hypothetical protein